MGKHAIVVIKNNENKYLQKYIDAWSSYLFLNCKLENEFDIETIKKYVSEELGVNNIDINYVDVKTHTKMSQKDKVLKEYIHYFFNVVINEDYNIEYPFKWFSMEELEKDNRIMEVNSDVISYVKELKM